MIFNDKQSSDERLFPLQGEMLVMFTGNIYRHQTVDIALFEFWKKMQAVTKFVEQSNANLNYLISNNGALSEAEKILLVRDYRKLQGLLEIYTKVVQKDCQESHSMYKTLCYEKYGY